MSEVKRYVAIGGMMPVDEGYGEGVYVRDGDFRVLKSELEAQRKDFDRVTAERDAYKARELQSRTDLAKSLADHFRKNGEISALQQRLTAADERADVLEGLVGEVLDAIGREPLDLDAVLRLRARMRAALKPAEAPRNQCDGCQAGIPLINGTHRMGREGGYPDFMGCSAKLYKPAEGVGDDTTLEEDREDFKKVFVRINTKQGQSISLADMIARYEKKP